MTQKPTPEEIRRVRQWECSLRGHEWRIIENAFTEPVRLTCDRCAEFRRITPHTPKEQAEL